MAVCRPTNQEAQTAAGVRSSRFLPKTARRAPKALEAGAFWGHRPKRLFSISQRAELAVIFISCKAAHREMLNRR